MPAVIQVVTRMNAPRAVVFDLELDVDVHAASLPGSRETVTTSSGCRRLRLDDEVTFRARHLGVVWRMTTRITEHDRPARFVDEQVIGPFKDLRHEHIFDDSGVGQTRMTDRMTITLPGGALGAAVARFLVAPYLGRLLRQRAAHIKRVAEAEDETA